jgi:hypothetical protein
LSIITTYPLNGIDYDARDAAGYNATRTSGVYSAEEDFAVTPAGGIKVTVSAGQGWVQPARFEGYSIIMREAETLTLALADGQRPRIDRIVLRFDAAGRKSSLLVLQGTPDTQPTAPAISRTATVYDLCLAEVTRPAGSTSITAAHIKDTRTNEALCGIMRDAVTRIPTEQLIAQAEGAFQDIQSITLQKTVVDQYTAAALAGKHSAEASALRAAQIAAATESLLHLGLGYLTEIIQTPLETNTGTSLETAGSIPLEASVRVIRTAKTLGEADYLPVSLGLLKQCLGGLTPTPTPGTTTATLGKAVVGRMVLGTT